MEFSLAKWSFVFTKWTHKIKIYELQLHFSIKQLIRIETRKGNATVLQKMQLTQKFSDTILSFLSRNGVSLL